MGKYRRLIMASAISLICQKIQSQDNFAKIEKNYNVQAKELSHELNTSKDTLVLKSPKIIDYLYTINKDYDRELDFYNNTKSLRVPLTNLTKGKHVVVVGYCKMKVIFVVRVLKDYKLLAILSEPDKDVSNN